MRRVLDTFEGLFLRQPPIDSDDGPFLMLSAVGFVLLLCLPAWLSSYTLMATRDALVLGVFALSYDYLWGKSNTMSMGHGVFFGIGAYGLAIMNTVYGWSPGAGILLGVTASSAFAFLLGYFLIYAGVRLHFFAIITMATLLIVGQVATSWSSLTAGDVGILGIAGVKFEILGRFGDFTGDHASYFLSVAMLATFLLIFWRACRGNYGKVLAAVGTNELRAKTLGYDTSLHLLIAFVVSAAVAAFSGAIFAAYTGVISPDVFSYLISTEVILWVAIGGRGTLIGPVVATVLLTRFQQEISSYSTDLWPLVVGSIMLALIMFLPGGYKDIASAAARMSRAVRGFPRARL
jgi:ABC-type branched-subunit amino acid transport system permease subunit